MPKATAQGPDRDPVVMTGEEAAEKFGVEEEQVHTCEGVNQILVWDGDLSWKGKMNMDGDGKTSGTIVSGDLTVDGDVANWEMDYGNFLWVGGDLKCRNLINGGGEVYVKGDVVASGAVVAHGNNGRLTVDGKIAKAEMLVVNDFHETAVNVAKGVPVANDGDDLEDREGETIASLAYHEALVPEVLEDSEQEGFSDIDWPALQERLEAGTPVAKKRK